MQLKQLRQLLRSVTIIIRGCNGRTAREKKGNSCSLALPDCLVECRVTVLSCRIDLCARVEKCLHGDGDAANCSDLQWGLSDRGARIGRQRRDSRESRQIAREFFEKSGKVFAHCYRLTRKRDRKSTRL